MRKIYTDEYHAERNLYVGSNRRRQRNPKPYGFFGFLFDVVMVLITGGLWLIWIFVREMRRY